MSAVALPNPFAFFAPIAMMADCALPFAPFSHFAAPPPVRFEVDAPDWDPSTPSVTERRLFDGGKIIAALKNYRTRRGASLQEARKAFDYYR